MTSGYSQNPSLAVRAHISTRGYTSGTDSRLQQGLRRQLGCGPLSWNAHANEVRLNPKEQSVVSGLGLLFSNKDTMQPYQDQTAAQSFVPPVADILIRVCSGRGGRLSSASIPTAAVSSHICKATARRSQQRTLSPTPEPLGTTLGSLDWRDEKHTNPTGK